MLSYLTSNEGLNLHPRCYTSIHVEQGTSHSSEHQAWSRVRRIGQGHEQEAVRIINTDTIDRQIEHSQCTKVNPLMEAMGAVKRAGNIEAKALYDVLIGNLPITLVRLHTTKHAKGVV